MKYIIVCGYSLSVVQYTFGPLSCLKKKQKQYRNKLRGVYKSLIFKRLLFFPRPLCKIYAHVRALR